MQTVILFRMTVGGDFSTDSARRIAKMIEAEARNKTPGTVKVEFVGSQNEEAKDQIEQSPGVKMEKPVQRVDGPLPDRSQKDPA